MNKLIKKYNKMGECKSQYMFGSDFDSNHTIEYIYKTVSGRRFDRNINHLDFAIDKIKKLNEKET